MQLTTALALTTILAVGVQAQAPISIPSPEELESEAAELFASNTPVYDSLTAYYATHSFTMGSGLSAWVSKIQTVDFGNLNTEDLTPEQIALVKSVYADLPMSDVSNLLYQYFPTSIVGHVTEIEDNLSQFAAYITATRDSEEEEVTSSSAAPAATASSGSVEPGSTAAEVSAVSSATPAPISSPAATTSRFLTTSSGSHSSAVADASSSLVSSSAEASTPASSTAVQANAATHMTLSASVVLGLSGAVAALALI
ncbi:hypothetical protein DV495_003837 [Geotrichum candidum]|uniref:Uncharacterized protein n=2 Tax=Geotrichum candidum TaxID=1173061 RepID=A0A0J9X6J3_GEOCN|nr:hypothetical protein DV452_004649 [Geotrichum candidum]KAI9214617.1 hypothetical protein DS838_000417 [Geotrichum bryndzae]KAF5109851.1 hypothetical protein DV454_004945 [Geotrichum candidum]KAF5124741.1 hypothetical protein DV495_003837 [Geotrichum candidum]KAF7500595.1 hypothetical protein DV113_001373 [Geotrichum candidum]